MELLLGCGSSREKKMSLRDGPQGWTQLITLDMNEAHRPNCLHDLMKLPYPFNTDQFHEIHAYDVMEHLGSQGNWAWFFNQWSEIWRILRPGGCFFGISPALTSPWLWGDPGHTRVISPECLFFLDQTHYAEVGRTPMTDYRPWYKADFRVECGNAGESFHYLLQAIKPARTT